VKEIVKRLRESRPVLAINWAGSIFLRVCTMFLKIIDNVELLNNKHFNLKERP